LELEAITPTRKTGSEQIVGTDKNRSLLNFWQWAYSDLIGNTERGAVAEYLVALACGIDDKSRVGWDTYDLKLNNRIKIEVKSSAYLQSWKQKDFSKPTFSIRQTIAWDAIENVYSTEKKRHADVYVFALLAHKDQETLNPLDTSQWVFYVIHTNAIDSRLKEYKQVSLWKLEGLGAVKSTFGQLLENIIKVENLQCG
jgi:hypothetical protein